MKKKIFMFVMAFAIIFPVAFLLSACGEKKFNQLQLMGFLLAIMLKAIMLNINMEQALMRFFLLKI